MAQQNKNKKCKGCKDGGSTLVGLIMVFFSTP